MPSYLVLSAQVVTYARTVALTSDTVRNTFGLSSVVILFTEFVWHSIVLCFQSERVGDPLECDEIESNVVTSAPTSKTLTKPSLAAVTLYSRAHSSISGSKATIMRQLKEGRYPQPG